MIPASYSKIYITGVRFAAGREDLPNITHVRWEGGFGGFGETRIEAVIVWMDFGGEAYVRRSGSWPGRQVHIAVDDDRRYLRSYRTEVAADALFDLPHF